MKWLTMIGGVGLGLALIAAPAQAAPTAPSATLIASVYKQQCRGPEFVYVTLTATLSPPQRNVRYTWDFNNDGIFDTAPSQNPTVTHFYPAGTNQIATATVKVISLGMEMARPEGKFASPLRFHLPLARLRNECPK